MTDSRIRIQNNYGYIFNTHFILIENNRSFLILNWKIHITPVYKLSSISHTQITYTRVLDVSPFSSLFFLRFMQDPAQLFILEINLNTFILIFEWKNKVKIFIYYTYWISRTTKRIKEKETGVFSCRIVSFDNIYTYLVLLN